MNKVNKRKARPRNGEISIRKEKKKKNFANYKVKDVKQTYYNHFAI